MSRHVLDEDHIHPAIRPVVSASQSTIVEEVRAAVLAHPLVVVGMGQNPFCRRSRRALDAAGIAYTYLEYGNYLSEWRRRTALKMWTGWPTMPMIFVKGVLIGGANDLQKLLGTGELARLLAS